MPARWISPRVRGARTDGPAVAAFARDQLGIRLLPWQRAALDVALQHRRGRRLYRDVTVTVPRQSGKSTLILAVAMWTMSTTPDSRVVYAAQSKVSARQKLLRGWWPVVHRSPLAGDWSIFRANGSEAMRCSNGSELVLLSGEESTGHGETADVVFLDESWSAPDDRLEIAARPMLATKANGQLWAASTAGTGRPSWWWDRLDAARTCAQLALPDGHCLIEWSAPPDADPLDEAVWEACMPALNRTISLDTVRADAGRVDQFRRSWLNQRPGADDEGWAVIPRDVWEAAQLQTGGPEC
jgi:phage terminase large subunit-like protein